MRSKPLNALKIPVLLLGGMAAFSTLKAQQVTIKGVVMDENSHPLAGAQVIEKGKKMMTTTDSLGRFELPLSSTTGNLLISYVSKQTAEVAFSDSLPLAVRLLPSKSEGLSDIVVTTALGLHRDSRALGYAVQTVNTKDLASTPDPNLVNDLAGKVAGVQITNGGAGVGSTSRIVIRGETSMSGSNQPLFVVDGVPINNNSYFNDAIENGSGQGVWAETDWGNGAADVNPNDIASISVLKGGAAAALYGTRAANGAIVITTLKGKHQSNNAGVTVNTSTTFESALRLPRIQNEYGAGTGSADYHYTDGTNSYENNIGNFGHKFDGSYKVVQFDSPIPGTDLVAGDVAAVKAAGLSAADATPTLWQGHSDNFKNFLQTGITNNNYVSFGGSDEKGSYHLSVGNLNNKGLLPNMDYYRNTVAFRGSSQMTSKLSSNVFFNYINSYSNERPNIGYGSESVMYSFFGVDGMPVNVNLSELKNKWWQSGQQDRKQYNYWANHDNPYVTMYENTNSFKKNRALGNASLKYDFSKKFNVMVRTGTDFYQDNRESKRAFGTLRFPNGGFRTDDVTYFENNTDFLASYTDRTKDQAFGYHFSAGGNRFIQRITYKRDVANSLIVPGLYNFSNASTTLMPELVKMNKDIYSVYGFANLDYKHLIYMDVTARNDWSSTLPIHHNSYFYPSVSLSAILSDMIQLPTAISYLKLRGSVAQVGQDADPYSIYNTYLTNNPFDGTPLTTANNVLANSNLKASKTTSTEGGFVARFLSNRLGLDFTYYNMNTVNNVVNLPIPTSSGYSNAVVNGGKINNRGFEIMLTANPIRSYEKGGFNWDMNFNFSRNVGYVRSLPNGISTYKYLDITQYDRTYRSIQYNAVVGEKLGNMYGRVFERDSKGNIIYQNGLPQYTGENDRRLLGNYHPNFILGWHNDINYKNFDLAFTWDWHEGGKFYSYTELGLYADGLGTPTLAGRETGIIGKGVNADGTPNTTSVTAATWYQNGYYNPNISEPFMYSASYLKLREINLAYNFNHIFGRNSSSDLRLAFIARNVLLFTQNKDVDPETLALRGTQSMPGVEFLSVPSSRSIGFSASLKF